MHKIPRKILISELDAWLGSLDSDFILIGLESINFIFGCFILFIDV